MRIKWIAAFMAILLIAALLILPFTAEKDDPRYLSVEVASVTAEAASGTQVQVPVSLTGGSGYISGTLSVAWDPLALTLASVDYTDLGPDDGSPAIDDEDRAGGIYRMRIGNSAAPEDGSNIVGTGVLFTLNFTVAEGAAVGEYPVTIGERQFLDFDIEVLDLTVNVTDGMVTLIEPVVPTEPSTEATEPASEIATEPATQPATEPSTEPTTDPATEPVTEAPTELTTEPSTEPEPDLLGDVNLNGYIDILDATAIQRHLASIEILTGRQSAVADTNRSGGVDIIDATYIQRYLAGLLKAF